VAATNYQRGRDLEYRVQNELRQAGFKVIRSAGSKSPVDLVAIGPHQWPFKPALLFVQCKRDGALPPAKWNELYEWAVLAVAAPILAEQLPKGGRRYWQLIDRKTGAPNVRQPYVPWDLPKAVTADGADPPEGA